VIGSMATIEPVYVLDYDGGFALYLDK
jgi:hypothetical protein